jgi:hypothetical protein
MPEMRVRAIPRMVAILGTIGCVLVLAACVPRPAGPGSQSARAGGTTVAPSELVEMPTTGPAGPTPIPSFTRPTPMPAPTFLAYTIKRGDTLTSIAREFHTTPRSIAFWSRGEHASLDPESPEYRPDRLEVGWIVLLIPDAVFDEDELMDATPSPSAAESAVPEPSPSAAATPG